MTLTPRETCALRYIAGTMGTTGTGAFQVGMHLYDAELSTGGYMTVGAAVCGSLRKRGLIAYVDGAGWRTTETGRAALSQIDETARRGLG